MMFFFIFCYVANFFLESFKKSLRNFVEWVWKFGEKFSRAGWKILELYLIAFNFVWITFSTANLLQILIIIKEIYVCLFCLLLNNNFEASSEI